MTVSFTVNPATPTKIVLRNVPIGYANGLNEARINAKATSATAKPQFSSVFFVPKASTDVINAINAALWAACVLKFKDKAELKWGQIFANNKVPFKNGDLNRDKPGYEGTMYVQANARADQPPVLLDNIESEPGSGRPRRLDRPQNRIYSGALVNVELSFWGYDKGSDGLACDMLVVQFAGDGERFSGGAAADESAFGAAAAPNVGIGAAPAAPAGPPANAAPAAPQYAAPSAPAAPAATAAPQYAAPTVPTATAPAVPAAPGFNL